MTGSAAVINRTTIEATLKRVASATAAAAEELNAVDGALGDGDIGITVSKGFAEAAKEELPEDVGMAFLACAKAFQRVVASSFGTLIATGFMAVAKATKGRTEVPLSEAPALIAAARDAMMARGKGNLGDKTVLDSLDALAGQLGDVAPEQMGEAALRIAAQTIEDFKGKPCKLGRARMFGDKSADIADPGQFALLRIIEGAVAR